MIKAVSFQLSAYDDKNWGEIDRSVGRKRYHQMQSFRNLKVWQKSHQLTLCGYRLTRNFPKDEQFGLTSQIRRACSSIGANIAEGCGRSSDADMARFLYMTMGSASEVEYHFLLAKDLGFLEEDSYHQINSQIIDVKRMLACFLKTLKPQAES